MSEPSLLAKAMLETLKGMSVDDRVYLAVGLIETDAEVARRVAMSLVVEAEEAAKPTAATRAKGHGRPFWLKVPTGIKESEKRRSAYRLEGQWVGKLAEIGEGTEMVAGLKLHEDAAPGYAIVEKVTSSEVEWPGTSVVMQGVRELVWCDEWDDVERELRTRGLV